MTPECENGHPLTAGNTFRIFGAPLIGATDIADIPAGDLRCRECHEARKREAGMQSIRYPVEGPALERAVERMFTSDPENGEQHDMG